MKSINFMNFIKRENGAAKVPARSDSKEMALRPVRSEAKEVSPTLNQSLAHSFIKLYMSAMAPINDVNVYAGLGQKLVVNTCDALAVWAAVWSLGATCDTDTRPKFGEFLRKLLAGNVSDVKMPKRIQFPDRGSVFDYCWVRPTPTIHHRRAGSKRRRNVSKHLYRSASVPAPCGCVHAF